MTVGVLLASLTLPFTLALMPLALALLQRLDVHDLPSTRSSHDAPVLRGGGIAPALAAVIVAVVASRRVDPSLLALALAGGLLALIGMAEDIRGMSPLQRLALQLVATAVAAAGLAYFSPLGLSASTTQLLFGAAVSLWLVSFTNAFNFMDGINGISGAQATVAGFGYAAMGLLVDAPALVAGGVIAAGAGLGFLPFNFPRARVFLGDAGSYFFGGWLGMLPVLALRADVPIVTIVAPVAIYLADTGTTLAARVWRGEPWHLPHKAHVYQRLTLGGWSHTRVTTAVTIFTASCLTLGVWAIDVTPVRRLTAAGVMVLIVMAYLKAPHLIGGWRKFHSRRAGQSSKGPPRNILG